MQYRIWLQAVTALMLSAFVMGCAPSFNVFPDSSDPLQEITIEGEGKDKILLLPVHGVLSVQPRKQLVLEQPSIVEEVVAQLNIAAEDQEIKSVVLLIDSPGGSSTASDILFHEISRFRTRQQIPVVASLLGLATSGGYYTALAADMIMAHPTTVTGSVGTVFLQPKVDGLLNKIGVEVVVYKSGRLKDMGSLFRNASEREKQLFETIIENINSRFLSLVNSRRKLDPDAMSLVAEGGVFSAPQAREAGLVDRIGYVRDAIDAAREMAGLPDDARVVVYRRTFTPDETIYNRSTAQFQGTEVLSRGLDGFLGIPEAGFYYIWMP